jgi:hypothetical protein
MTARKESAMRKSFSIAVGLVLAGASLATAGGRAPQAQKEVVRAEAPVRLPPRRKPAAPRPYEGRIKDVRPVWGILILTVGKGKEARDMRFDISEARIVGPDGNEWKGQDLRIGDRVRVGLTAGGRLVQQVSVLRD